MILFFIERPKDNIIVGLMRHKISKKFHFINFSKDHICPCEFDTEEEAIQDLEKYKVKEKIIKYYKINQYD